MHILAVVESYALAFAAVASGTSGLLIVALQALGYVIMDNITYIGLVNTHAKSNGCHNHVNLFHDKGILSLGTGGSLHACMVGHGRYLIGLKYLGQLLNLFTGQAVYYA